MISRARIVIVGSIGDPHVTSVASRLSRPHVLLDAERLAEVTFAITPTTMQLADAELIGEWRGWLRRLAPPDWENGVVIGSHDAASKASWLTALAFVARHPDGEWLTGLDALTAAEGKLHQYAAAGACGLAVPKTIVSNDVGFVRQLGPDLVAKPLGPSHFMGSDGEWLSVFTEAFDPESPMDQRMLQGPPFLVQERIEAQTHLRITTVGEQAWVFELDAHGLPIDWREEATAHHSWRSVDRPDAASSAIRLAQAMNVGYSSQDWIVAGDGREVFIDLNPSGQWLFLPQPAADAVSSAIATWLEG